MGRWEPGARGRLEEAALELYAERGYDQTTVAQIAERAGVTERTFYRHFADKREVLFSGSELLAAELVAGVAEAPEGASAYDAVADALGRVAVVLGEQRRERAPKRQAVIDAHPELRERELGKMAAWATTLAAALAERGVEARRAELVAQTGVAVFRVVFAEWVADPVGRDIVADLRRSFAELRAATTD